MVILLLENPGRADGDRGRDSSKLDDPVWGEATKSSEKSAKNMLTTEVNVMQVPLQFSLSVEICRCPFHSKHYPTVGRESLAKETRDQQGLLCAYKARAHCDSHTLVFLPFCGTNATKNR
jgi:hypothetical protein